MVGLPSVVCSVGAAPLWLSSCGFTLVELASEVETGGKGASEDVNVMLEVTILWVLDFAAELEPEAVVSSPSLS